MKAVVYVHTRVMASAELHADVAIPGCIRGALEPNEHYLGNENLHINVQLANGYFLMMNGDCRITNKNGNTHPELILERVNDDVMDSLLKDEQSFLGRSWSSIDIHQKIGFESELDREIKNRKRSFWGLGPQTNKHALEGFRYSALGKADGNDDVLFLVRDNAGRELYAVVHLTWSNNMEENPAFPATTFFNTLEDFKSAYYEDR